MQRINKNASGRIYPFLIFSSWLAFLSGSLALLRRVAFVRSALRDSLGTLFTMNLSPARRQFIVRARYVRSKPPKTAGIRNERMSLHLFLALFSPSYSHRFASVLACNLQNSPEQAGCYICSSSSLSLSLALSLMLSLNFFI